MKKIVIAQLSVVENKINPFIRVMNEMAENSRNEDGCLTYRVLNEIEKPYKFLIYEVYLDDKAVEQHNKSEHFKRFISEVPKFITKKPIIGVY